MVRGGETVALGCWGLGGARKGGKHKFPGPSYVDGYVVHYGGQLLGRLEDLEGGGDNSYEPGDFESRGSRKLVEKNGKMGVYHRSI